MITANYKKCTKNLAFRVNAHDQAVIRDFADELDVKMSVLCRASLRYLIEHYDEVKDELNSYFED